MELILKRRTELALRALRALAVCGERVQGADLAARIDTSPNFLTQVMAPLIEVSWVKSGRGPTGGYALTRPASEISMLDLIEAAEGSFPTNTCVLEDGKCSETDTCALHDSWQELRNAVGEHLAAMPILRNDTDG